MAGLPPETMYANFSNFDIVDFGNPRVTCP